MIMTTNYKNHDRHEPLLIQLSDEDDEIDAIDEFDDDVLDDNDSVEVIQTNSVKQSPTTRGRGLRNQPTIDEDDETLPPSKTKIKKQMHELRDLGKELTDLGKDQLAQLDIPENLHDAIREFKNLNKFGAIRRQLQYIGKLMRQVDTAPIIAKLDAWKGKSQHHIAYMHQLERWRDRLLENESALTELLAAHPDADAQRLRTLIRNAQKEIENNKPPKNFREIFQILRQILPEPQ
jgi:ribosome-associated protein